MLIENTDYFDLASLAEACYAEFCIRRSYKDDLIAIDFSTAQAETLLKNWSIVSGTHRPNTSSDFSSTLFQSNDGNGFVLAFRGTEPSIDPCGDLLDADIFGMFVDG